MSTCDQGSLEGLATAVGCLLLANGERLATAESCTGGWVGQCLTAIAGSSAWFERGFITYSNDAKTELLGVTANTLATQGAVSEATAAAMALGALRHSHADWALAITGIAGPGGGSPDRPVGTVCFAWASSHGLIECETCHFPGDREAVRRTSVEHALHGLGACQPLAGHRARSDSGPGLSSSRLDATFRRRDRRPSPRAARVDGAGSSCVCPARPSSN